MLTKGLTELFSLSPHWVYIYIFFLTLQWSSPHKKEMQYSSMDKNVDQCFVVECTATPPSPPPNQFPWERKKNAVCFFLYWCFYPHRSRDSVSPLCRIFLNSFFQSIFLNLVLTMVSIQNSFRIQVHHEPHGQKKKWGSQGGPHTNMAITCWL